MSRKFITLICLFLGVTTALLGQEFSEDKKWGDDIIVDELTSDKLLGKYLFYSEDVPANFSIDKAINLPYKRSEKEILILGLAKHPLGFGLGSRIILTNLRNAFYE